jgi:hypothetical protein
VGAPPRKPENPGEAAITGQYSWRQAKRRQSSRRIAAGHANAELRQWRPLQRWTGRRQDYAETHCAIAGLISDRAAKRAARHRPTTELVPAFPHKLLNRPTHITPACPDPNRGEGRQGRGGPLLAQCWADTNRRGVAVAQPSPSSFTGSQQALEYVRTGLLPRTDDPVQLSWQSSRSVNGRANRL